MNTYRVTFERIGRNHSVAPLVAKAKSARELADHIYKYARPHLRSSDVDVFVELDAGKGFIACGMHTGGSFTIANETMTAPSANPDAPSA